MKNNLYKGSIESYLFQLLSQNGRMYGYEISKKIKEITDGDLVVSESKLYPALHKMEAEGLLEVEVSITGSRLRKYYKLTSKGVSASKSNKEEIRAYIDSLSNLLNPKLI